MKTWLTEEIAKFFNKSLPSGVVVAFSCDGCMASDHNLMWVGRVDGFEQTQHAGRCVRVEIIKEPDRQPGDIRDRQFETRFEFITIGDGGLQEIQPGLWFWYR